MNQLLIEAFMSSNSQLVKQQKSTPARGSGSLAGLAAPAHPNATPPLPSPTFWAPMTGAQFERPPPNPIRSLEQTNKQGPGRWITAGLAAKIAT